MKSCELCAERAVIHITEIEDDNSFREVHLCFKHAQEYLRDEEPIPADPLTAVTASLTVSSNAQCPVCGITFDQFRATGRLGCPHDYEVFQEELAPLLRSIHHELQHYGKVPGHVPSDRRAATELLKLRQELQHAIESENYERAAQIRDMIAARDPEIP